MNAQAQSGVAVSAQRVGDVHYKEQKNTYFYLCPWIRSGCDNNVGENSSLIQPDAKKTTCGQWVYRAIVLLVIVSSAGLTWTTTDATKVCKEKYPGIKHKSITEAAYVFNFACLIILFAIGIYYTLKRKRLAKEDGILCFMKYAELLSLIQGVGNSCIMFLILFSIEKEGIFNPVYRLVLMMVALEVAVLIFERCMICRYSKTPQVVNVNHIDKNIQEVDSDNIPIIPLADAEGKAKDDSEENANFLGTIKATCKICELIIIIISIIAAGGFLVQRLHGASGLADLRRVNLEMCAEQNWDIIPNVKPFLIKDVVTLDLWVDKMKNTNGYNDIPSDSNVPFENLLLLNESDTCKLTIIEGDMGYGKVFLAKKLGYVYATNKNSVFNRNFELVIPLSVANNDKQNDLTETLIDSLRTALVRFTDKYPSRITSEEIMSVIRHQKMLILIYDVNMVSQGNDVVHEFILNFKRMFPNSRLVVFQELSILEPKLVDMNMDCRYKLRGLPEEGKDFIINLMLDDLPNCKKEVNAILEQEELYLYEHVSPLLLVLLAHACKEDLPIHQIIDSASLREMYMRNLRKVCKADEELFEDLVRFGQDKCINHENCVFEPKDLEKALGRNPTEKLNKLEFCGFLFQPGLVHALPSGKYCFRRFLVLAGAEAVANEQWQTPNITDEERIHLLEKTLKTDKDVPTGMYLKVYKPEMVCQYGNIFSILLCFRNETNFADGRFIIQQDVVYNYKYGAVTPSYVLINGWNKTFKELDKGFDDVAEEIVKDFLSDKTCSRISSKVYSFIDHYSYDEDEFNYLSQNCSSCQEVENVVFTKKAMISESSLEKKYDVHSRYKYEISANCFSGMDLPARTEIHYHRWFNRLERKLDITSFYSFEQKSDTGVIPKSFILFTYDINKGIRLAFYQRNEKQQFIIYTYEKKTISNDFPEKFKYYLSKHLHEFPLIFQGRNCYFVNITGNQLV